jgi:glycosyltransferase involved in cell wall biosynthesis
MKRICVLLPGKIIYDNRVIKTINVLNKYDFVVKYICRKDFSKELTGIKSEHHYFGADYYDIISSFDLGISPFLVENLRTKGKIAMKHQEFLLMGIPQICSPVAISEFVAHDITVLIATNFADWGNCLTKLLDSYAKREQIGNSGKDLFNEIYTFDSQYVKLADVLLK